MISFNRKILSMARAKNQGTTDSRGNEVKSSETYSGNCARSVYDFQPEMDLLYSTIDKGRNVAGLLKKSTYIWKEKRGEANNERPFALNLKLE